MTNNNFIIIDENVIIDAWRGTQENGNPAFTERHFVYAFFDSLKKLAYNEEIKKKIIKLKDARFKDTKYLDNSIVPILTKLIHDSIRATPFFGISTNFKGVKKCDEHFVGVTLQSQGILVTNDQPLHDAIDKDNLVSKCTHVNPKDGIDFLK